MSAVTEDLKVTEEEVTKHDAVDTNRGSVRLVIYDFDQTITTGHLYRELHGGRLKSLAKLSDDKLISLFGGKERISYLDDHFKSLCAAQIEIGILSFGWSDVIERALERMELGRYFEGKLIIGRDSDELVRFNKDKGRTIAHLMKRRKLEHRQVSVLCFSVYIVGGVQIS